MTRSQMIETVARKTGFTEAQVETTMDAMFDQIADWPQDCTLQMYTSLWRYCAGSQTEAIL